MKKGLVLSLIVTVVLGFSTAATAFFGKIGTANYDSDNNGTAETYNLIYETDNNGQGVVWLDYTRGSSRWSGQVAWASALGGNLSVTLDPGYTTTIDWGNGWRLPGTDESKANLSSGFGYAGPDGNGDYDYRYGYNMINSEMGRLYYVSLGNKGLYATDGSYPPDYGLIHAADFNNLKAGDYWSGTEYSPLPNNAWLFNLGSGYQYGDDKNFGGYYALAVRPVLAGEDISSVPIPGAVWLLGSGFVGIAFFRKKFHKA